MIRPGRSRAALLVVFLVVALTAGAALHAQDVPLERVLVRTGARLEWDPWRGHGVFVRGITSLAFTVGNRFVVENGDILHRAPSPGRTEGTLYFSDEFLQIAARVFPPEDRAPRRIGAIFLDPGHGGRDPGAIGRHEFNGEVRSLEEKRIVLDVARRLRLRLVERYPDRLVVLSRSDDTYLTLEERTNRANEIPTGPNESVLFVSIHANASLNSRASGFEVWVLPPEFRRRDLVTAERTGIADEGVLSILNTIREEEITLESTLLARSVLAGLDAMVGDVSPNRGIREESWYVVRNARMPSVLVELGFVTNREEFLRLEQGEYLQRLTDGIYSGITNFVRSFEEVGRE